MTTQEAADLVAVLRTAFPAGDVPPELTLGYTQLLQGYDTTAAQRGVEHLMHTHKSRYFPSWAVVEYAIVQHAPAYEYWTQITASLDARRNTPPDTDPAARYAIGQLGGWTQMLDWDGSRDLLRDRWISEYNQHTQAILDAPKQIGSGSKTLNLSGDEHCAYCEDDGWVILAGTVRVQEVTYDRGNTACRWCEAGEAAYRSATTPRKTKAGTYWPAIRLEADYTADDLHHQPASDARITKQEYAASAAGKADPALKDPDVRKVLGLA